MVKKQLSVLNFLMVKKLINFLSSQGTFFARHVNKKFIIHYQVKKKKENNYEVRNEGVVGVGNGNSGDIFPLI
jgi:hypothetical protein